MLVGVVIVTSDSPLRLPPPPLTVVNVKAPAPSVVNTCPLVPSAIAPVGAVVNNAILPSASGRVIVLSAVGSVATIEVSKSSAVAPSKVNLSSICIVALSITTLEPCTASVPVTNKFPTSALVVAVIVSPTIVVLLMLFVRVIAELTVPVNVPEIVPVASISVTAKEAKRFVALPIALEPLGNISVPIRPLRLIKSETSLPNIVVPVTVKLSVVVVAENLAEPVTSSATVGVLVRIPTLLVSASTYNTLSLVSPCTTKSKLPLSELIIVFFFINKSEVGFNIRSPSLVIENSVRFRLLLTPPLSQMLVKLVLTLVKASRSRSPVPSSTVLPTLIISFV